MLEKTLESPLDCKEIEPVNPKGNQPEYSLEGLMLKLKLQYFGHLLSTDNSLEKSLMVGMIEGRRRCQRMSWLDSITNALNMNLGKLQEMVRDREGGLVCCSPRGGKESDTTGWLNNNSSNYNDSLCSAKTECKSSVSVVAIVVA